MHIVNFEFEILKRGNLKNFSININPLYSLLKSLNLKIVNIKIGNSYAIFSLDDESLIAIKLFERDFPKYKNIIPVIDDSFFEFEISFIKNVKFPFKNNDNNFVLLSKDGTGCNIKSEHNNNTITYKVKHNKYSLDFPILINNTQIQDYLNYHPDADKNITLFTKDNDSIILNKNSTFLTMPVDSSKIDKIKFSENPTKTVILDNSQIHKLPKRKPLKSTKKNTSYTYIDEDEMSNIKKEWIDIAKEEIVVKFYDGIFEAFGSEISALRLFFHFKDSTNRVNFRDRNSKWVFTYFNNFKIKRERSA